MKIIKNSFLPPFIIFAILILITAFSLKNIYELNNNSKGVVHTYEVKMALANNLSLLIDMETGQRGFSLTGNRDFLESENSAKPQIQKNFLQLQQLLKDNPSQLLKLDSLKQLIDLKIEFNAKVIKAREQLGLNAVVAIISTRRGKQIMDGARKISGKMVEVEEKLINDRNKIVADSYFLAQFFAVVGGIISILIAIFLMIINNKSLKLKTNLLKSEAKFKQVLESAPDGIVVIDNNRKMQMVNVQTEKLFGYTREEMIGKAVEMLMPDRFREAHPDHERKFIAEQKTRLMGVGKELFGKRKDGSEFVIEISLVPLQLGDEKEGGIVLATIRDITVQKNTERKIITTQAYTRSLIEASLDPLATISPEGKITDVNEASAKVTGETREKLIGTDFSNYFTEPEKAQEGYKQVFEKGFVSDYPLTIRHATGKLTDVLYNASVYKDDEGNVLGVFAAARDVTAQKQTSRYARSLIEASLDPLVTISLEGKITDVNQASAKVTGETRDKLIGTDFSVYFTEPEKASEGYKQVFEKGFVSDYPLTIRHATGKLTDVLYNASVYKDGEGNVLGVFAAARDVTAQKQASRYARSLIEASLDPLVTISLEGKITDVNEASTNVTGETRDKLIGTDFSDYFTEPNKARQGYKQVFEKGFVSDYPLTIRHATGKLTDVLYNASVYKDDEGNVLGVFAAARDVTDQKRISEELKEAKVIAELATILAEDEKAKAESALQSKQQFLANMSHEIRTPMNAILGFTKIILKTDLKPKQKEYLDAIKTSSDGLIVLINDILDLAKVDAGKMTFEQTPFKMESSITTMFQVFDIKIQEKNLELVKEYDKKIPEVLLGDAMRLHQILLNLLSNALKFTEKGKITVAVRLVNEDKEKATIEFAITDTGTGILEDKLESIFENFQQATSSTSRIFGGTGLGLAICKQLVEKQGGTISVKSKIDEGSTFGFTLSFQKTNGESKKENVEVELVREIKDIKILVVEDVKLNQLLMRTILDDFKFKYDIADNGKIAIEKMQTETYDIILMDLQMPEMNGFEATKYIRDTMNSKIPIIALTADVTTVDVEKCKAVGMNDYVSKPLDERILYSKIIELLKR